MKRALDLILTIPAIVVAIPLIVLIYLVLWIGQGRPVLFTQMRAGRNGNDFLLYKFRTMTDERDASGELLPDPERTTFIGRFLRRSRMDELLQLFHVLKGDMSLVGPRPVLPETVRSFGALGKRQGSVRPGLTGWAQVNGNATLENPDKMALDVWYVDNQSMLLDLEIMLRTFGVILHGDRLNQRNIDRAQAHAAVYCSAD